MSDLDAYAPLREVMAAAGRHQASECLRLLDEAEGHLPAGFHGAREHIETARAAVAARQWVVVWGKAHHAMVAMSYGFPPDLSVCPPRPRDEPIAAPQPCPTCGGPLPAGARFCPLCGTPLGSPAH